MNCKNRSKPWVLSGNSLWPCKVAGGLVANMTSKIQNESVKLIFNPKKLKKFVILHKRLVFNFVKASFFLLKWCFVWTFYQNIRIYFYFGVMCRCIQGRMFFLLTFNSWVWKVTASRGVSGDWNFKILIFYIFWT